MLDFRPIELCDKSCIEAFVKPKNYMICEYSFVYLMLWKDVMHFEYCVEEDVLFIRGFYGGRWLYFLPVTKTGAMDEHYLKVERYAEEIGQRWKLVCAEYIGIKDFSAEFLHGYEFIKHVDLCDYIYRASDLIELPGKKYHKKRNHVSKFHSKYEYEFLPLRREDFSECLAFYDVWLNTKPEEMSKEMMDELSAIKKAFQLYEELGLVGACIKIDGKIRGFTIGEYTNAQMGTIHFEKCDSSFDGIFATINQLFAKEYFSQMSYINRQDDMGLPGLRKAKQSYYPVMMGDKYNMIPKGLKQDERAVCFL